MSTTHPQHGARLAAGLLLAGMLVIVSASAASAANGNNGTLKIHELGTPTGTPNNDPKVGCDFNVEGFHLDPGQTGTLVFTVQGGDQPAGVGAGPFAFGPADADGYAISQDFSATLPSGHYTATLFGKGDQPDVKAKSKAFKVTCEGGGGGGIG